MTDHEERTVSPLQLTDELRQDEGPLGYLVLLHNTTMREYELFVSLSDARGCASRQEREARAAGEPKDWSIYPLYAGPR